MVAGDGYIRTWDTVYTSVSSLRRRYARSRPIDCSDIACDAYRPGPMPSESFEHITLIATQPFNKQHDLMQVQVHVRTLLQLNALRKRNPYSKDSCTHKLMSHNPGVFRIPFSNGDEVSFTNSAHCWTSCLFSIGNHQTHSGSMEILTSTHTTQHNTTTNTTRDAHNNLKRLCHLNQTNSIALPFLGVGSSVYLHPPCFHSIFPKRWSLRWPAEKSGSTDLSVKMGQPELLLSIIPNKNVCDILGTHYLRHTRWK